MKTEKIQVNSRGEGRERALEETSHFAEAIGLKGKSALRLRLLAEETIGMVNAITEIFVADYWVEQTDDGTCFLHLDAETAMNLEKKEELIEASTDHVNRAATGFMGKIWELVENGMYQVDGVSSLQSAYGIYPVMYGSMGAVDLESANVMNDYVSLWSMNEYRDNIKGSLEEDPGLEAALNELEKSIVASIADEVRVGVRGNKVELVIEKKPDEF